MSKLNSIVPLTALMAVSVMAQNNAATPIPATFTRSYNFVPIGIAGTETLQVNVVNAPSATPTATSTLAPVACTGSISFADASGKAIGSPVSFSVTPGQIFSAPLPFGKTGYSSRGEVVATVQQTVQFTSASQCALSMSVEVFDTNSGVTHAILTSASPAFPALFSVIEPGVTLTTVR